MTKRYLIATSTALAIAASVTFAPSLAEAYVRPPIAGHAGNHSGHGFRSSGTRMAGHYSSGHRYGGYSGGLGGFTGGYYGYSCDPIQIVLGLCGPLPY